MRSLLRSIPVRIRSRPGGDPASDATAAPAAGYRTACAAPAVQLRLDANGLVTTCCRTLQPLGHIGRERLIDIWRGERRRTVEAALERWDFSEGCQPCGAEIAVEGRGPSYAAIHDEFAVGLTADPATRAWPRRMEMNLSNLCNLQCIQCDGESSSSIRLHRERLPPMPVAYGDEFFEDLELFLPHLDHIVFAGGEPFMSPENFRVWDMVADLAPHITCKVVTNATQWNRRVERVLDRIPMHFIFSIDGITKPTYESIRIGADFDAVMDNVERFRRYAADRGTTASVNHCLMPQNHHEFADLLLWAEERRLFVNVSVVRTPAHACIAQLPVDELVAVHRTLLDRAPDVEGRLALNAATWTQEIDRIGAWAAACADTTPAPTSSHTVMWFRAAGAGPHDDSDARDELDAFAAGGPVGTFDVDGDDRIVAADAPFLDGADLIGATFHDLGVEVARRFGAMADYEVLGTGDDRVDARATFGTTAARITTVAMRDAAGWADRARILVALAPAPDAAA